MLVAAVLSMNSSVWKNADLCSDGVIDSFDMIKMRKLIVVTPSAPSVSVPVQPTYKFDAAKQYTEYEWSYKNTISQAGTVVKESYNGINGTNSLNVYLPYGYDESKKYNVFYFMHGM